MRLFVLLIAVICAGLYRGVGANSSHYKEETRFLEDRLNTEPHSHHEQFIGKLNIYSQVLLL